MEHAINAITLREVYQKIEYYKSIVSRFHNDLQNSHIYDDAIDKHQKWEALVEPVMKGQIITERP